MALLERGLVHLETELNKWREAGKEIGRKLGVVEERKRIVDLLNNSYSVTAILDDYLEDKTFSREDAIQSLIQIIEGKK